MDHQAFAQLLGNYGEFVGAIAVVATLGYLAVQLRQNALTSKSEFLLQIQSEWNRQEESLSGNERLLRLRALCRQPELPSDLSVEDQELLRLHVNSMVNTYASVVMAYNNRQMDDSMYKAYCQDVEIQMERYPAMAPIFREVLHVEAFQREQLFKPFFARRPNAPAENDASSRNL